MACTRDGIAMAHVVQEAGETLPRLVHCAWQEGAGEPGRWLTERVRERDLQGVPCTVVLPPEAVRLRLVPAPRVPDDELVEAARWLVREGLEFEVAGASIQVLPIAAEEVRNRQPRICVAIAEGRAVAEAEVVVREAGLLLDAVDMRERSLLRLVPSPASPGAVDAVLFLGRKEGVITIGQGERVLMARSVAMGVETFEDTDVGGHDAEERARAFDLLVLDVQRLLDYDESTFDHGAATRLWVAPAEADLSEATRRLGEALRIEVGVLELGRKLDLGVFASQALQARCLAAIGAALPRGDGPRLDLRSPKAEPRRGAVSARRMVAGLGACAVLVAGLGAHETWQTNALESVVRADAERVEMLRERVAALQAQVEAGARRPETERRLGELRAARDAQARLLQALGSADTVGPGVANVLAGLSRAQVPEVWLRAIHLREGGRHIDLQGSSLEPEGVARLLQSLAQEAALEGHGFRTLRLERSESDPWRIDFELSSGEEAGP